ncbi:transposase [Cupriavidus basilensis]
MPDGATLLSSTMSLARFAREHDLNHNQLARWRREYEQGTYGAVAQVPAGQPRLSLSDRFC